MTQLISSYASSQQILRQAAVYAALACLWHLGRKLIIFLCSEWFVEISNVFKKISKTCYGQ